MPLVPDVPLIPLGIKTVPVAQVMSAPPAVGTTVQPVPLTPLMPSLKNTLVPLAHVTNAPPGWTVTVHPTPLGTKLLFGPHIIRDPLDS